MTKICSKCNLEKSLELFSKGNDSDGLQYECKQCNSLRWDKRHREMTPEKKKLRTDRRRRANQESNALTRYGISNQQVTEMLERQNNCCLICVETFTKTPHIDHCHVTGEIRGLLCSRCNMGLGMFRDNPSLLQAASRYLQKKILVDTLS